MYVADPQNDGTVVSPAMEPFGLHICKTAIFPKAVTFILKRNLHTVTCRRNSKDT